MWIYNFGSKAKKPYRQSGMSTPLPAAPVPVSPGTPTAAPTFALDPAMLGSGLALVLFAALLQIAARRRRTTLPLAH